MRKALIVGIDHYKHVSCLHGCVTDARAVKEVLERNADGSVNFATPRLITSSTDNDSLDKAKLLKAVRELFAGDSEVALFYFAGHGYVGDTGGFICSSEVRSGDEGLPLSDVMILATESAAKNKVIILDSCHAGIAGARPGSRLITEIKEGTTILTASTETQNAVEDPDGGGVFTSLLVDALDGAAANLVGEITPGSVYAHIDRSLGPWAQRPVFKTNVKSFISLRKVTPSIELNDLRELAKHFPTSNHVFALDPSYEPERFEEHKQDPTIPPPNEYNTKVFALLQRYVKVNLVRPVGAPHMWHAAMQSKACELTKLGQHYRNLVAKGLL